MKRSITLISFALCAAACSAAQAASNGDAACTQLSSDIAARSALFVKVADAKPALTESVALVPAAARQGTYDKTLALHNIANEIWSLRTRMAYLGCSQAEAFVY